MVDREYLSGNQLDVNFVNLISPTYSMQLILGSSCVVMSGNVVSAITIYHKVYSILWIALVTGSFYYFELTYYHFYYDKEKPLFYTFAFGLLVQYVSYMFNVLHARFFKSEQTVAVFLKIQKIDRDLKKNNLPPLEWNRYVTNRMWVGYVVVSFGCGFLFYVYYNTEEFLYTVPMGCAILTLYLEVMLTGNCIYYLALRLQYLNNIVTRVFQSNTYMINGIKNIEELDRVTKISCEDADKIIKIKDFTNILTSILKLFHETSSLFTFEIFNVVVTVFIWTFLVIESAVVGLRSKLVSISTSVILTLWILFYFLQIVIVAFSCDWFAKQVRDTKRLALYALALYCEDKDAEVRKASWELLQLIEFEQPVFSVYGLFTLNMRLPLQLISVITTNVLVLIQYTSNALNTN